MFKRKTVIIKSSIKDTLKQLKGKGPDIVVTDFYGDYKNAPYELVIWYFFKTNEDWKNAEDSGFTEEIRLLTKSIMIKKGYPASAFDVNVVRWDECGEFIGFTEEQKQEYIKEMTHLKVEIAFASEEDVEEKANGNYYHYFK